MQKLAYNNSTVSRKKTQESRSETKLELLPSDPTEAWIVSTFNCRYRPIQAPLPPPGAKVDNWRALSHSIRANELLEKWRDPYLWVGTRFNGKTRYAMVDIDRYSKYRNSESIAKIQQTLEEIGLCRTILTSSSYRGGADIGGVWMWVPLPDLVSTAKLAQVLEGLMGHGGFIVKNGQLEIFPNNVPWGTMRNAHKLPGQIGFYLLDNDLNPVSDSIEDFINIFEACAKGQDFSLLESVLDGSKFKPSRVKESSKSREIKALIDEGWTGDSQSNDLFLKIAGYHRLIDRLEGEALVDAIVATCKSLPGFDEFCGHKHNLRKRAVDVARWAEKTKPLQGFKPKSGNPLPDPKPDNNAKQQSARERIQAGVRSLDESGELPQGISDRADQLVKVAGVSRKTLYRKDNLVLWHPEKRLTVVESACKQTSDSKNHSDFEALALEIVESLKAEPTATCLHEAPIKSRNSGYGSVSGSESKDRKIIESSFSAKIDFSTGSPTKSETTHSEPIKPKPKSRYKPIDDPGSVTLLGSDLMRLGLPGFSNQHYWTIAKGEYSPHIWRRLVNFWRQQESRSEVAT